MTFDPQNYAAHATTLKQFDLILSHAGDRREWLADFSPPHPLHFAGHIWRDPKTLSPPLPVVVDMITDYVQRGDIGYGYGALAAGADIVVAEILLEEGAELHVILPCGVEDFRAQSVTPFGAEWEARFEHCLNAAQSVMTLSPKADCAPGDAYLLTGRIAMGQAILRGRHFNVTPQQLLIWDRARSGAMTSLHAQDWAQSHDKGHDAGESENASVIIPIALPKAASPAMPPAMPPSRGIDVIVARSADDRTAFGDLADAVDFIAKALSEQADARFAVHYDLADQDAVLAALLQSPPPDQIRLSRAVASGLALLGREDLALFYAGLQSAPNGSTHHSYSAAFTA